MKNQIPFNLCNDGTALTIKAQYHKSSLANFIRRGGTEQQPLRCLIVGQIWKSKQNGKVYSPEGIAPCICVGNHAGVEPKIIVYEN